VPGFSRFIGAHMIATRAAHDVLGGMAVVLGQIGAVQRTAVWDQEGCIGQWRKGKQVLTEPAQRFCGTLGMGMRLWARRVFCEAMDGQRIQLAEPVRTSCGLDAWLLGAVLATRGAAESPLSSLITAPELLGFLPEAKRRYDSGLLEVHGSAGSAVVELRQ